MKKKINITFNWRAQKQRGRKRERERGGEQQQQQQHQQRVTFLRMELSSVFVTKMICSGLIPLLLAASGTFQSLFNV
jgi:hypothetical protein